MPFQTKNYFCLVVFLSPTGDAPRFSSVSCKVTNSMTLGPIVHSEHFCVLQSSLSVWFIVTHYLFPDKKHNADIRRHMKQIDQHSFKKSSHSFKPREGLNVIRKSKADINYQNLSHNAYSKAEKNYNKYKYILYIHHLKMVQTSRTFCHQKKILSQ